MTEYKIHPSDPNYNAALRDVVMDMAPFYDPNHRCGIVRDKIFHGCLEELREREKLTSMKLERERDEARAMARDQRNQLENISTARLLFPWES